MYMIEKSHLRKTVQEKHSLLFRLCPHKAETENVLGLDNVALTSGGLEGGVGERNLFNTLM